MAHEPLQDFRSYLHRLGELRGSSLTVRPSWIHVAGVFVAPVPSVLEGVFGLCSSGLSKMQAQELSRHVRVMAYYFEHFECYVN